MTTLPSVREIVFLGLREDNPRDFLAALGLLRLMNLISDGREVRLRWSPDGHPSLCSCDGIIDNWNARLSDYLRNVILRDDLMEGDKSPHVNWINEEFSAPSQRFIRDGTNINSLVFGAVPSVSAQNIGKAILNGLSVENITERDFVVSLLAALLSQVHVNVPKDKKPRGNISAFSFANKQGQKYLLYGLQQGVMSSLDFSNLTLPELPKANCQTFRWSPDEYRPSAYLAGGWSYRDSQEANIAAFMGLSFYPVVDRRYSEETLGFSNQEVSAKYFECFTWPVWGASLTMDPISSLLLLPQLHAPGVEQLHMRARGCFRVWRSRRFSADKSLYFSPAEQLL